MKRKLFTAVCFLLAAAMLPTGASAEGAEKGPKKEVGIQLYSVRSLIGVFGKSEGDYKPVLQALADMGYTFVEAASYKDGLLYGTPPQQFRRDVEATGMKVLSTHCTLNLSDKQLATGDFTEALKWWDECIAAHKAAGVARRSTGWRPTAVISTRSAPAARPPASSSATTTTRGSSRRSRIA